MSSVPLLSLPPRWAARTGMAVPSATIARTMTNRMLRFFMVIPLVVVVVRRAPQRRMVEVLLAVGAQRTLAPIPRSAEFALAASASVEPRVAPAVLAIAGVANGQLGRAVVVIPAATVVLVAVVVQAVGEVAALVDLVVAVLADVPVARLVAGSWLVVLAARRVLGSAGARHGRRGVLLDVLELRPADAGGDGFVHRPQRVVLLAPGDLHRAEARREGDGIDQRPGVAG